MKRVIYIVAVVFALVFGVTFAFHNRQTVEVGYYLGLQWQGPLSLALLAALSVGIVIGYLTSFQAVVRMQRQLVRTRKELRDAEQEVQNLRALPIKDVI
jgi:lipopolysaccharide assembly protein A